MISSILIGAIVGLLSIFVGSNIDRTFNVFKGVRCFSCSDIGYSSICKNGHKRWLLFSFVLIGGVAGYIIFIIGKDQIIFSYLFLLLLLSVSISDLVERIVPDKMILFFLPILLTLRMIHPYTTRVDSIVGGVVAFGFFFLVVVAILAS